VLEEARGLTEDGVDLEVPATGLIALVVASLRTTGVPVSPNTRGGLVLGVIMGLSAFAMGLIGEDSSQATAFSSTYL
jgi:hypothetical protein